ncbi:MAG: hypothetical protein HY053_02210 [Proteobacteria bacterium]|nr:hypothetical protein [Pseudomonadota bacterium]
MPAQKFLFEPSPELVAIAHKSLNRYWQAASKQMLDRMSAAERTQFGVMFDLDRAMYKPEDIRHDTASLVHHTVLSVAHLAREFHDTNEAFTHDLIKEGVFDKYFLGLLRHSFHVSPEEEAPFIKAVAADLIRFAKSSASIKTGQEPLTLAADDNGLKITLPAHRDVQGLVFPAPDYWFQPSPEMVAAVHKALTAQGPIHPYMFGEHGPAQIPYLNLMLEEPELMRRHVVNEGQSFVHTLMMIAREQTTKDDHVLTPNGAFDEKLLSQYGRFGIPPEDQAAFGAMLLADAVRSVQARGVVDVGELGKLRTDGRNLIADLSARPPAPLRSVKVRVVIDDANDMDSPRV